MEQESYLAIEQALKEGNLSEALALLVKVTQGQEKSIREDAALLQSKFEYNRNQYEVKGILTDQEFNIHFSKTMQGVQNILDRIRRGPELIVASVNNQKFNYRPVFWLIGLLSLATASWFLWPDPSEITAEAAPVVDSSTVSIPFEQDSDVSKATEPVLKPKTKAISSPPTTAIKPPPEVPGNKLTKEVDKAEQPIVEEVERAPDPPPARTFTVSIIRNSDMSDAGIYVDGQPATILSDSPIITTVQVTEKSGMHQFELRKSDENINCKKGLLITRDNQKITFNCT